MTEDVERGTLGWFIDQVLLADLKRMVFDCKLHYLSFGVIASGIEFLGACMDDLPMNEEGHSRDRFSAAVRGLFDARYQQYVDPSDSTLDLYTNLRCGMAHVVRPQGRVGFTNRAESQRLGTSHLDSGSGALVLVCEDLYEDFAAATARLRDWMGRDGFAKHLTDPYLAVPPRDAE